MTTPASSFIWYELMTPDADAASAFYASVVDWTVGARVDPAPAGRDYRMIGRGDGGFAGGVLQLTPEMTREGAHPAWLAYLYVPDVDRATSAIVADGGRVIMPRLDLPVGPVALVADPMGTPFYVMTPIPPPGKPAARSDVFDPVAAGHVRWNELASPDLVRAKAFYAKHFGFAVERTMSMGPLGDYCFIDHGGQCLGAIMGPRPGRGAPLWLLYFGVRSIHDAAAAIERGGGRITNGPHEVPGGDWIVMATDPHGAAFGVVGPRGA